MPRMTAPDCIAFCVLVASAVWAVAVWIPQSKFWKGLVSESESKIESKESIALSEDGDSP
jgi:hypothetical protein